jgi:hypothetical protein
MSGRQEHSNRTKLAMKGRCLYTEYRWGFHPDREMDGTLNRKGASRTHDGTGAPENRGIS